MVISATESNPPALAKRRRQTANARQAFDKKFPTPEAKSAHFRAIAQRAHDRRLTLCGDDAEKLRRALALLTLPGSDAENHDRALALIRAIPKLNDLDLEDPAQEHQHEAHPGPQTHETPEDTEPPIETHEAHEREISTPCESA